MSIETTRERIRRERNERKAESDLRDFARKSTETNETRYINVARQTEMETRMRELNAPPAAPAPVRGAPAEPAEIAGGSTILPFEISVTPTSLVAAPGTINGITHDEEVNETMTNGTWYFRAKVVISSSTGSVSSTDVLWATSEASDTATDFYITLATVDIISGVPDATTISQFNYGPITSLPYGTPTDKWGVLMF